MWLVLLSLLVFVSIQEGRIMKITIDLRLKRLITVAEIKGDLDATLVAESATRGLVKKMLVKSFKQSNLRGSVFFDGEQIEL